MEPSAGLIPARAGTTLRENIINVFGRAHPRSRGDHTGPFRSFRWSWGSSPLARGPPGWFVWENDSAGLIPARAGTTRELASARNAQRAHPRSRGDHEYAPVDSSLGLGSSPLARGPLAVAPLAEVVFGLIPARAGTTVPDFMNAAATWAHPRSRGDHLVCLTARGRVEGSSPLARGPLDCPGLRHGARGLIPARAGTTLQQHRLQQHQRAHPRSRGDHTC